MFFWRGHHVFNLKLAKMFDGPGGEEQTTVNGKRDETVDPHRRSGRWICNHNGVPHSAGRFRTFMLNIHRQLIILAAEPTEEREAPGQCRDLRDCQRT